MKHKYAFRLCGELAKIGVQQTRNVQTGNITQACVDATLELLDMASSVISYYGEHVRTAEMESQNEQIKMMYDEKLRLTKKSAEEMIKKELEASSQRISTYKITLEKEKHELQKEMELLYTQTANKAESKEKQDNMYARVRNILKDTIDAVGDLINQLKNCDDNSKLLPELNEQFRIATMHYSKFVAACC